MLHTQERNFTKKKIFFEKQLLEQKKMHLNNCQILCFSQIQIELLN